MRMGIIGAGNMGVALAAQLTQAGHQVAIANSRGPRTLTGVAAQTGAAPVPLAESWRQQPSTPVYTTDLPLDAARQALADATPEQTASWRS